MDQNQTTKPISLEVESSLYGFGLLLDKFFLGCEFSKERSDLPKVHGYIETRSHIYSTLWDVPGVSKC